MVSSIPAAVIAAAARWPDRPAIEEGGAVSSFAALETARLTAARAFIAAGIVKGDRVAIWAPNMAEWIVAAVGLQSAGAVLVPLNTRFKGREAGQILRASRAKLLLTVRGFLGFDYPAMLAGEDLPDLKAMVILKGEAGADRDWPAFLAQGAAVSEQAAADRLATVGPGDPCDMLFTSGTTGLPKGVVSNHGQTVRTIATWSDVVGLTEQDRFLVVNPFFHSFGYKAGWLACLLKGAACLPEAVFDTTRLLDRIETERVSVLPGAPTVYQSILGDGTYATRDLSSLRLAVTGAASVPVDLIRRMFTDLKFDVVLTAYGLTEAPVVTMCETTDDAETIANRCGKPIPGVEVICADAEGREVPRGAEGEVLVRGYNVMAGYFENETATREAIDDAGWLHTGDIGVMDERGYLKITDRKKDMFIVGGFNCYPAEIENIILSRRDIAQAAVIGVPDERMGEVAKAIVVPARGAVLEKDEFLAWCRANMANYKAPRQVEICEALPLTASGKVQKFMLR
ncbi:FadD3 family acyl-CoA ligase [Zavarzinia aquatilis]|uniref:Fatty acid--CoA ligase n=1 Tax=Zavarzinia aquatilis TaxID=2211142 RepID=A0A317E2L1_9PROT|nr:FadD3 family acyl-CoA ligase [Zavarzinia aquatilis]PWR20396.1 fatty acid--CoA ligase [Zavarzinia aquatilis]